VRVAPGAECAAERQDVRASLACAMTADPVARTESVARTVSTPANSRHVARRGVLASNWAN
jgi:hypothetical protein